MTITLHLEPREEAKLLVLALERGISAHRLVRQVIDDLPAAVPEQPRKPRKSASGLLAQYGPGPTEEGIDENRREKRNI
jgi:hypothetical protein